MSYPTETVEVQASGGLVLTSSNDLLASRPKRENIIPQQPTHQMPQPTQQFAQTQQEDEGPIEDMSVAASNNNELTAQQAVAATQALASLHSAVHQNVFVPPQQHQQPTPSSSTTTSTKKERTGVKESKRSSSSKNAKNAKKQGRRPLLTPDELKTFRELALANPNATLAELRQVIKKSPLDRDLSKPTICRYLQHLQIPMSGNMT